MDGSQELDLTELIDVSPYTVFSSASLIRSYRFEYTCLKLHNVNTTHHGRLFTSLGLRQLVVINADMVVSILVDYLQCRT